MLEKKINALINFLRIAELDETLTIEDTITSIEKFRANEFETSLGDYLVLTEEEAEEEAKQYILDSLWAFNSEFILQHTEFYNDSTPTEDEIFCKSLTEMQSKLCESANPIVKALIDDIDTFIDDAILSDGRANFLSTYDGNEQEQDEFLIYRTN